jgi:hypothetical protein
MKDDKCHHTLIVIRRILKTHPDEKWLAKDVVNSKLPMPVLKPQFKVLSSRCTSNELEGTKKREILSDVNQILKIE